MMLQCQECAEKFSTLYRHEYWLCPKCGAPVLTKNDETPQAQVPHRRRDDEPPATEAEVA